MRGLSRFALAIALASPAAAAAPGPAPGASVLTQAMRGLWEISGAPGAQAPVRQCVADIAKLGQFEHRDRTCSHSVISDSAKASLVQYSCGAAGFGRSEIRLVTPRSLKISTQGISDNLPFNYELEAHRVGDCPKAAPAPRH